MNNIKKTTKKPSKTQFFNFFSGRAGGSEISYPLPCEPGGSLHPTGVSGRETEDIGSSGSLLGPAGPVLWPLLVKALTENRENHDVKHSTF